MMMMLMIFVVVFLIVLIFSLVALLPGTIVNGYACDHKTGTPLIYKLNGLRVLFTVCNSLSLRHFPRVFCELDH